MKQINGTTIAERFKRVFSECELNGLGKAVRYCQRERVVTPFRLMLALVSTLCAGKVETLADIQRSFNALFGASLAYKPFHNRLAKRGFAEFMRACVERLLEKLVLDVLKVKDGQAFSEFRRIVIQDGSSFAVKDTLSAEYTFYPYPGTNRQVLTHKFCGGGGFLFLATMKQERHNGAVLRKTSHG